MLACIVAVGFPALAVIAPFTEAFEDGVSGFVCEPAPEALALRFRELMDDAALAERLGQNAYARGSQLTWPQTVRQLTALSGQG